MSDEKRAITTTVSCSVSGAAGHLSAEVDGRYYGYNHGKSMYLPGDGAIVLVFKSKNVQIVGSASSPNCGFSVSLGGGGGGLSSGYISPYRVYECVSFNTPVGNTQKPVRSIESQSWESNSGATPPIVMLETTLAYCRNWGGVGRRISDVPLHGFLSLAYVASYTLGSFSGMQLEHGRSSATCHATIFGVATPIYPSA